MAISFLEPAPVSMIVIESLEFRLGSRLPVPFRDLLAWVSNGGEIKPVAARSANSVGVSAILGAERGDHLDIEIRSDQYQGGRLPGGLIPVADAEGGNLVCLSLRPDDFGTVWFWDHELELSGNAAIQIAHDFNDFLNELVPIFQFEVPSAVTEAWIDPALLTELEDD